MSIISNEKTAVFLYSNLCLFFQWLPFHISHLCSRFENALKIHYLFIQIAHAIRQLLEYGFASVKKIKRFMTKKEISKSIINSLISSTITNLESSDLNFQLRFDD